MYNVNLDSNSNSASKSKETIMLLIYSIGTVYCKHILHGCCVHL